MNHDRIETDQFQKHHIVGERLLQPFFRHGIAAIFDDDSLAMKALQEGQCFCKDLGFKGDVLGNLSDVHRVSVDLECRENSVALAPIVASPQRIAKLY